MVANSQEPLTINLALHLVERCDSGITKESLANLVFPGINEIWKQAGIQFLLTFEPDAVKINEWPDIDALEARFVPDGVLHGFYGCWRSVPTQGYLNGINTNGRSWRAGDKLIYCVRDHRLSTSWSPPLERVSSHEIGHILGLDHYSSPKGYLMTSSDPGIALNDFEIVRANQKARTLMSL